jgi:hypothetical protein
MHRGGMGGLTTRNKGLGVAVAADGCEMVSAMVDRLAAYPWPHQRPETPA